MAPEPPLGPHPVSGSEPPGGKAAPAEPFPSVEFKGSRVFFGVLLLVVGFFAAGLAALGSVVLSSLAVLYGGWAGFRLIAPGRVRATEDGIVDETFWYSPGLIPWAHVTDVRPTRWGLVEIDLVDEDIFLEGLGPLVQVALFKQRLYGFGPALLVPWVLRGSRRTIVDGLQVGLDAYTHAALTQGGSDELPESAPRMWSDAATADEE